MLTMSLSLSQPEYLCVNEFTRVKINVLCLLHIFIGRVFLLLSSQLFFASKTKPVTVYVTLIVLSAPSFCFKYVFLFSDVSFFAPERNCRCVSSLWQPWVVTQVCLRRECQGSIRWTPAPQTPVCTYITHTDCPDTHLSFHSHPMWLWLTSDTKILFLFCPDPLLVFCDNKLVRTTSICKQHRFCLSGMVSSFVPSSTLLDVNMS